MSHRRMVYHWVFSLLLVPKFHLGTPLLLAKFYFAPIASPNSVNSVKIFPILFRPLQSSVRILPPNPINHINSIQIAF
jgi:hypothetical protein